MKIKLSVDNFLHILFCALCAFVVSTILAHATQSSLPCCMGGFIAAVCLGVGKEFGDYRANGNTWSWSDMMYNCIGAFIGCWGGLVTHLLYV